ncbi:glycosyltransferase family 4 protein [Granulosicoccaceae sp. 1_MG-2023]|nr:glycosyltransferase family 4 protein [Granulosicoccaceae sp. 1_MG-2023]
MELDAADDTVAGDDAASAAPCSGDVLVKPVLFVVDSFFPAMGGAERQSLVLARSLRERGVRVEFVCPQLDKSMPLQDSVDNFPITRIPFWRVKFLGAFLLMANFALYMNRHRNDYSYIHVHITKLLAATLGMLRGRLGCAVITKISGHAEFSGGVLDRRRRFNPAYRMMQRYIRRLDYVQTISQYTREVLIGSGFTDEQILLIPNAVEVERFDEPEFARGVKHERLRIGFVGRVEQVKGLDVLLQAVAMLPKDVRSRISVNIAGDGRYLSTIRALSASLGLDDTVAFLGAIDDVPGFLKTLDIYVQPSYAEGLSNAVLEAMCASLPVIASQISGNTDLVDNGRNGLLFPSGQAELLSQCLSRLTGDESARRGMGQAGRQVIESGYSSAAISQRLIGLYKNGN